MNSIYLRLLLPLGVTVLVAMLVAWAIALYLLTNAIDRRLDAQLGNATAILAEGTFPFSPDLIRRLDRIIEARIVLLNDSGDIGLSTGGEAINAALSNVTNQLPRLRGDDVSFVTVSADNVPWRAAVRRLQAARDSRYRYVVAAASLSATRQVAWDSALLLGAAMFLAAAALAWIGSFFTRSITRPITDLAHMADRVAEGERDISTNIDESNEIGVLAGALTEMAAKLEDYESELARQSRLSGLGDLAARMAHEVRNPLTAIKIQLQLLEERFEDTDGARIQKVLEEIRRLELIVESTLVLGGPLNLKLAPTDPAVLIDEVAELLRPALSHRGIELSIELRMLPTAAMDPDRMKQVLLNLINNAAEELPQGGAIRISGGLSADGGSLDISVEDSGPGIDELRAAELSAKPFSLGLGLTISREIVDGHGGELLIGESEDLGGARFTVRLPISIIAALPA